jgi:hypothetical protein
MVGVHVRVYPFVGTLETSMELEREEYTYCSRILEGSKSREANPCYFEWPFVIYAICQLHLGAIRDAIGVEVLAKVSGWFNVELPYSIPVGQMTSDRCPENFGITSQNPSSPGPV